LKISVPKLVPKLPFYSPKIGSKKVCKLNLSHQLLVPSVSKSGSHCSINKKACCKIFPTFFLKLKVCHSFNSEGIQLYYRRGTYRLKTLGRIINPALYANPRSIWKFFSYGIFLKIAASGITSLLCPPKHFPLYAGRHNQGPAFLIWQKKHYQGQYLPMPQNQKNYFFISSGSKLVWFSPQTIFNNPKAYIKRYIRPP